MERLFPRQDQRLDAGLIVLLLLQHSLDLLRQIDGVTSVVTSLRGQLLGLRDVITIALNLLLRLGEMTLRGLQRARRESRNLRFVGLSDQRSRFVENAALDRDQLGIAQQHFSLGGALLCVRQIAALVFAHRLLEAFSRPGPRLARQFRSAGSDGVLARLDDATERLTSTVSHAARALQCRLTFLHPTGNFFSGPAAFGFPRGSLTCLNGGGERLGREHIELFGAGFFHRRGKCGRIGVARTQRRAGGQTQHEGSEERV